MMSSNQSVLHSSEEKKIMPNLSALKRLFGSSEGVASLVRKFARFQNSDLDNTLMSNVKILKSSGEPRDVGSQAAIFPDLGFSDDEILTMIRRQPTILSASQKKLKSAVELLIETGKYNISEIGITPSSLGYNIEKRLKPRLQNLGLLESRNWSAIRVRDTFPIRKVMSLFFFSTTKELKNSQTSGLVGGLTSSRWHYMGILSALCRL